MRTGIKIIETVTKHKMEYSKSLEHKHKASSTFPKCFDLKIFSENGVQVLSLSSRLL